MLLIQLSPAISSAIHQCGGVYSLGAWQNVTQPFCLPYVAGRDHLLPGCVPVIDTVNTKYVMGINLVILVL